MTISAAITNEIFLTYVVIIGGILGFAGLMLAIVTALGKDVSSISRTYRGWLVMAPLVLGTIFLGRTAIIVGVTLLAIFGFKEYCIRIYDRKTVDRLFPESVNIIHHEDFFQFHLFFSV